MTANDDLWHAQTMTRKWLRAIILQGNRCEAALPRAADLINRGDVPKLDALAAYHADGGIEEHFFLIALDKALRWLLLLARLAPEHRDAIKKFRKGQPDSEAVRDVREHDDEYLLVLDADKRKEQLPGKPPVIFDAEATSTIVSPSMYFLGGRVDVRRTTVEAEQLYHQLFPDAAI